MINITWRYTCPNHYGEINLYTDTTMGHAMEENDGLWCWCTSINMAFKNSTCKQYNFRKSTPRLTRKKKHFLFSKQDFAAQLFCRDYIRILLFLLSLINDTAEAKSYKEKGNPVQSALYSGQDYLSWG